MVKPEFISIVISASKNDERKPDILRSVFYVYRANDKAIELISYFADKEISGASKFLFMITLLIISCIEAETLLRDEGYTTIFFRRYSRVVGLPYLWNVFALLLNELKVTSSNIVT